MSSITFDIYSFILEPVLESHVLPCAVDRFRLAKMYRLISVVLGTEEGLNTITEDNGLLVNQFAHLV